MKMASSIKILQWNCRYISTGLPHLQHYLDNHPNIDVLLLQSLNTTKG